MFNLLTEREDEKSANEQTIYLGMSIHFWKRNESKNPFWDQIVLKIPVFVLLI